MVVLVRTDAERYIWPRVGGLGCVVRRAAEVVGNAFKDMGPQPCRLQRLSAAIYIARVAIEENVGPGTVRFGAVYRVSHRTTTSGLHGAQHLISVRVWVDQEALANLLAYEGARAAAMEQDDVTVDTIGIRLQGIPVENLEFRITGGWENAPGPAWCGHHWPQGDITEQLKSIWAEKLEPPF